MHYLKTNKFYPDVKLTMKKILLLIIFFFVFLVGLPLLGAGLLMMVDEKKTARQVRDALDS